MSSMLAPGKKILSQEQGPSSPQTFGGFMDLNNSRVSETRHNSTLIPSIDSSFLQVLHRARVELPPLQERGFAADRPAGRRVRQRRKRRHQGRVHSRLALQKLLLADSFHFPNILWHASSRHQLRLMTYHCSEDTSEQHHTTVPLKGIYQLSPQDFRAIDFALWHRR